MTSLLDTASLLFSAAGAACLLIALVRLAPWRSGLAMAMSMWLAAGLLRLAAVPTFDRAAGAAAIVVVRQIARYGLRRTG